MNGKILVLCDSEEEYAQLMTEFIKSHKEMPWELYTCTKVEYLLELINRETIDLLIIAENAYTEEIRQFSQLSTILLNESGIIRWEAVRNVNKYQSADEVYREIVQAFADMVGYSYPRLDNLQGIKFIGMYSPVRRCLQTSFALTLGQMLADKHKTLYINLEHYAGLTGLIPEIQDRDLSDLLYFMTADRDKFQLRIQTILRRKGNLDYIPPMKAGQNLVMVSADEWMDLLKRIVDLGIYEYVILDLSESIQGLFDLLRICSQIFTLTRDDGVACSKILQYEQILSLCAYEDVLKKTYKYNLPLFKRLPDQIEQFTKGDLAAYVQTVIKEVLA